MTYGATKRGSSLLLSTKLPASDNAVEELMNRRTSLIAGGAAVLASGTVAAVLNLAPGASAATAPAGGDTVTLIPADGSTAQPTGPVSIDKFSFGETFGSGSQSTGAGAGKVTFQPLQVTLTDARSEPALQSAFGSGQPLNVKVHAVQVDAGRRVSTDYTFSSVTLDSVAFAQNSGKPVKATLGIEYSGVRIGPDPNPNG